jgi:outer membrane protein insertion porin family
MDPPQLLHWAAVWRRKMKFSAAVLAAVLIIAASGIPAFAALQAQITDPAQVPVLIEGVDVRGNRRVPSDTIRYNMQTRSGTFLNPDVIQRDIRQLYSMGYFNDVRVEQEPTEDGTIIVFYIEEKPYVRVIEFLGMSSVTESDIRERLRERNVGLSIEQPYDNAKIRRARAVILDLLAEQGRQNGSVEIEEYEIPPTAVGVEFHIEEGPQVRVEEIEITGNEIFDDGDVKGAMQLIKETGPIVRFKGQDLYHPLKMNDDITRINIFYRENGYMRANVLEPEVEVRPKEIHRTLPFIKPSFPWGIPIPFWKKEVDRFYITIPVEENEQYRIGELNITGATIFAEADLLGYLGLLPGDVFNQTLLTDGFENLRSLYGQFGYINFTPEPRLDFDEQERRVNVTIDIDEDRPYLVNRINFRGNTTTRDKVIRREVMLQEGGLFSSQLWDLSVLRLNQLGYFEEILEDDAEIRPNPTDPEVDITLTVQERGKNSIGFSGGVSGIGGSFMGVDYSTNNFLGFGETLSVSLQGGTQVSNYLFSFTEPYLFDRPMSAGFSVFKSEYRYDQANIFGFSSETADDFGFNNRINYEQSRKGFNVFTSYPFKVFHRFGMTFQFENSQTSAVNPATASFFNAVRQSNESSFRSGANLDDNFRTRSIIPSYTWNTLNSGYLPTAGQRLNATFEVTGGVLGGNVNYFRPVIEYQHFKGLGRLFGKQNVVAFRFQGAHIHGFSGTAVPFYQRFFMGGDFDIRGFDFRLISPIAWVTRELIDPYIGQPIRSDDIAYLGGDTTAVMNLEYRIPIGGDIVTLAPFLDVGNSWVISRDQLVREVELADGTIRRDSVNFLDSTNSGIRSSAGVELQFQLPVINAPFRIFWFYNANRIEKVFTGPASGDQFSYKQEKQGFKFTVGRTF